MKGREMDNRFLCVMAGYDSNTERRLADIQQLLNRYGYAGEQTKNLPQHITLGSFHVEKENEIKTIIKAVAKNTGSFEITFNHIGIFGGSKVLFIAPDPNRELLDLKENFGTSYNWTPHTTMLIDKPEIIYQALPIIAGQFEAFSGNIDTLYLYEFWPLRFICKETLNTTTRDRS